ncbi:MAG: DNA polymerase III subunit delta [Alphaproteobacteria bacterium]|nr:MAG: DNA polymerase III subunit delta [Alphaproteobacteria bacterium]
MKLAFAQIDPFIAQLPRSCRVVLFYGPDEGMNRMRAQNIIKQKLGAKPDPFALIEMQAGELSDDPTRLLDEIQTMPFGGDTKIIYIRQATDTLAATVGQAIESCPSFSTLLIEAGELNPKSTLRNLCEGADERAAAVPAYDDEGRGLTQYIQGFLTQAGVKLESGALPNLTSLMSANRMVNKQELEKLLLYIHPNAAITNDDIENCLVNQSQMELDDVVYAAFSGLGRQLDDGIHKLKSEGLFGIPILRATARHALRLHWAKSMINGGAQMEETVKMLRPPIFFKKLKSFEAQLRLWNAATLLKLLARLSEAEVQCKSTGFPVDEITGQLLLAICQQAQNLGKRTA